MKFHRWFVVLVASASVFFGGCGGKSAEKDAKAGGEKTEEGEKGGGVAFKEGRGLTLTPDILKALSLKVADVEERPLVEEMKLLAQVFAKTPRVLASASVPEAEGAKLEKQKFTGATLVRIDRARAAATRRVDAVFALDLVPPPPIGEFVELVLASEPRTALAVPQSAVLDGATGTFVYVVNGEYYLRTVVKTGARSAGFIEITEGLYLGDVVVTTAVNQLWLAELRLTKGGGHSD